MLIPKDSKQQRPRATSFLPTSNPSTTSGRLGHPWFHRNWARTPWAEPKTPGSLQINLLFTMYAEHASAISRCKTFISSKDISFTASNDPPNTGQRPSAIIGRPVRSAALEERDSVRTGFGGAERDRTADPLLAKQVLSQLSYSPNHRKHLTANRQDQVTQTNHNSLQQTSFAAANGGPGKT